MLSLLSPPVCVGKLKTERVLHVMILFNPKAQCILSEVLDAQQHDLSLSLSGGIELFSL